jgi:phosphoribosylanthranilate isomerase
MRVKVCGLTSPADAVVAIEAGADALGMVFHDASPRRVQPRRAHEIADVTLGRADLVGVVVDATPTQLRELVDQFHLTAVQVHIRSCPMTLAAELGVPVLPFVGLGEPGAATRAAWWPLLPIMLDSLAADGAGGTGLVGDFEIARAVSAHRPVWLAGGLGPHNVRAAVAQVRPYGVDASSGLETSPGVKDPRLVEAYVRGAIEAAAIVHNGLRT